MASDGPDGCTSVEEWLAQGGTIKTERDEAAVVYRKTWGGTSFEWVRTTETSAEFKCRLTDVYGHARSHLTKGIVPYICAELGCREFGKHQFNALFWCDEHKDRTGKKTTR